MSVASRADWPARIAESYYACGCGFAISVPRLYGGEGVAPTLFLEGEGRLVSGEAADPAIEGAM